MFVKQQHILSAAFVISVMLIESTFALRCWDCNSYENHNCADPFDSRTIPIADCSDIEYFDDQFCHKSIHKVGGEVVIIRGCMVDDSEREESPEASIDLCNTDGCNSARNHVPYIPMIVTTLAIVGICNIDMINSIRK